MNPKVDDFISEATKWQAEIKQLRTLLLDGGLTEEFKWRTPCYSFQGNNVVIIGCFKNYCTLSFFKGALLKENPILEKSGENSNAFRLIRFQGMEKIFRELV